MCPIRTPDNLQNPTTTQDFWGTSSFSAISLILKKSLPIICAMIYPMRRKLRGAVLVYVTVAMVAFTGLVCLTVDLGHARAAKTELQGAVDAAARYAAFGISDATATARATAIAAQNTVDGTPLVLQSGDVVVGTWNGSAFSPGGSFPNAVCVTGVRSAARSNAVRAYFGGLIGVQSSNIQAKATVLCIDPTFGIVGINSVKVGGQAIVAGYYSAAGANSYNTAPYSGTVSSNGTITVGGGATISGDLKLGPAGSYSGNLTSITGTIKTLTSPLSYPNASLGTAATVNNNANIPVSFIDGSRNISLSSSQTLNLPGGTYYLNNISTTSGSSLNFSGPTTLYLTGSLSLTGRSLIGDQNIPSHLQIYMCSSSGMSINGNGGLYAQVYAPQSPVNFSGGGLFAGTLVASTIDDTGGASIYYDRSGTPGYVTIVQ
jgi:Flp pilus assembly protein TadG